MQQLIVATKNPGKVREIRALLEPLGYRIVSLLDLEESVDVVEDSDSFEGNALKKAKEISLLTSHPVLADDSGLEVDALNGEPGIYSARYGGPDLDDNGRYFYLLEKLADVRTEQRSARFRCAMAFVDPQGGDPVTFSGKLEGHIAISPSGSKGFGYDPVFIPTGYKESLATLDPETKNRISHRAEALSKFVVWLNGRAK